jgi:pimeloyl-ACP methyl ester carboxylesterase
MIASTERTLTYDDGATAIVESWGANGPLVVCVHGITSGRKTWARFAERFADRYRVVAYDQRGHGDSYATTGPMTLERSLLDLDAVLATLDEAPRALVGHSWGGAVVVRGGLRSTCDRVVAIDPMIHVASGTFASEYVEDLRPIFAVPPGEREPELRAMYADLPAIEIDGKVHAMRNMSIDPIANIGIENGVDDGRWDLRRSVVAYPKPLWFALADPDESVVSPEDVRFISERGGANVSIDVFTGQGHSLQRTDFEGFAAKAEAFLA